MKKLLLFLACLLGLLSGCSKDDYDTNNYDTTLRSQKIRWYGVKNPSVSEELQTRGVADEAKLWNQRVGISIKFLNQAPDQTIKDKVIDIAREWEDYAGIKFNFMTGDARADVRIAFDWSENDWLTWSYTGTDAKFIRTQTEPTAVFGGLQYLNEEQFRGDVLRLFGQILGLEYEQRHQDWSFWRSESKLQSYWEDMFDGMNMDWDEIRDYVFTPLSGENAVYPTQTATIDELSIMAWPYYTRTQTTKVSANHELSEGDKSFIAQLYPKSTQSLPTIQETWVNPGFMEWTDNTKTALRITDLGRQQEYFPDVSDGEQLTSAHKMFASEYPIHYPNYSALKKAPSFNTSNITDFSYMFYLAGGLIEIPQYNTSKGVNFQAMFDSCTFLTTIPLLDTSKGTNFRDMFFDCKSLTKIPSLDTSNGTNFHRIFAGCNSLKKIPLLDTSNGTNFFGFFGRCSSLNTLPPLNTAKGTDFRYMFTQCSLITTIPPLNTSKGTNFKEMFYACSSLISIPTIDTSLGTDFSHMFNSCSSLIEKPALDLSNATNTGGMYRNTRFAID